MGWVGEWVGLGVGVWCWDSVGRAVDVPTQRYSTYPLLSPPNPIQPQVFPTYPDRIRQLATPHSHHLAQTRTHNTYPTFILPNSTPAPPLLQPTLSDHIHSPPYIIPPPRHTLPPPNQTHSHTSTQPICPIIATPQIIALSNPQPSYPYMPTPPQRLSPVLARRTCHYGGFPVPWLLNTNVEHRI